MTSNIKDGAVADLKASADRAMTRGAPREALGLFERALTLDARRLDLWIGLAACRRVLGEPEAALAALEGALAAEPRLFAALLMKGSLLEGLGREKQAAQVYGAALAVSPEGEGLAEPTRRAMDHAHAVHAAYVDDLAAALRSAAARHAAVQSPAERRRAAVFAEAAAGQRRIWPQEPVQFHYPGLAAIEFYERDAFPWLEALEARTDAIRAECLAVWAEGSPDLVPYVNYRDGMPLDQWAELNRSLRWSAFHLLLDGEPVEENARRCPATMEALALVDQPRVPGRSPAAMFSILRPHTRIPPHTGVANTRVVVHLPLIVPPGCGFRVGGETREWKEGEAWVFDDTIEHEAWNDSDLPRAILICDAWSPQLSAAERAAVAEVTTALDRFNGGAPPDQGL